jgi:hypothetical protein
MPYNKKGHPIVAKITTKPSKYVPKIIKCCKKYNKMNKNIEQGINR